MIDSKSFLMNDKDELIKALTLKESERIMYCLKREMKTIFYKVISVKNTKSEEDCYDIETQSGLKAKLHKSAVVLSASKKFAGKTFVISDSKISSININDYIHVYRNGRVYIDKIKKKDKTTSKGWTKISTDDDDVLFIISDNILIKGETNGK